MVHRVVEAQWLAPEVRRLVVEAADVARAAGPGQFVIVRATDKSERIPLTIAHSDKATGLVSLIIQAVGVSTRELCALEPGQCLSAVAGPLGKVTETGFVGHAVLVGGGVGTAVVYPQAEALKAQGNRVTAIIGGRSQPYVILEKELGQYCDAVLPCTDDGSHGFHGFVTARLTQLIADASPPVKLVLCAGPVPMMRAVAEVTRPLGIQTIASLNPVMVDGTGMCGGCRVQVGGEMLFACVDGPEFDAHQVDFKELSERQKTYQQQERAAAQRHACKVNLGNSASLPNG
jgi:ferredoxin/flavodoxin---NADP+ reductase